MKNTNNVSLRICLKEITSITVDYDCVKYYDRTNPNYEQMRKNTCEYLVNEYHARNNKMNEMVAAQTNYKPVVECRYNPVDHRFTLYEVLPYIHQMDNESHACKLSLGDLDALAALKAQMEKCM